MAIIVMGLHVLFLALGVSALAIQSLFLKSPLEFPKTRVLLLARVDALYGVSAVMMIVTGLMRVFWYGKGAAYYGSHSIFWIKMMVFAVIGLLSIYPTAQFLRNREQLLVDWAYNRPGVLARLRVVVLIELILFLLLPFLATQMARGPHF